MNNPTYNGVPITVLREAVRARQALSEVSKTIDFLNLGTIATMEGMSHLSQWIAENPKGEEALRAAIEQYIEGREDF